MAAEAQAEGPAPAEKRTLSGDDGEEERRPPEPKRRRACVAALDGVPCAAAPAAQLEEADGPASGCGADGASFSFQHARAGFVALDTTPKFGSFNPPAAAEQAALDHPAPPDGEDAPEAAAEESAASARRAEEGAKDENSQLAGVGVDGQVQTNNDSVLTLDQP